MPQNNIHDFRLRAKQHDLALYFCCRLAPTAHQSGLFTLMALDAELAKIPHITQEEMIRMIRLTWWREAIEEIYAGKVPRAHEVVQPLADLIAHYGLEQVYLTQWWQAHAENIMYFEQGDRNENSSIAAPLVSLLTHLLEKGGHPKAAHRLQMVYDALQKAGYPQAGQGLSLGQYRCLASAAVRKAIGL